MWTEKQTEYGFNLVENEGGKTLGYGSLTPPTR